MDHHFDNPRGAGSTRTGNDAVALLVGAVVVLAILAIASLSLDFCLDYV